MCNPTESQIPLPVCVVCEAAYAEPGYDGCAKCMVDAQAEHREEVERWGLGKQ